MKKFKRLYSLTALFALPFVAQAHTGLPIESGFLSGFMHPWMGVDHVLAMMAVGLWALRLGANMRWGMPLIFVSAMLVGAGLAVFGLQIAGVETGIALSVIVLGVLLTTQKMVGNGLALLAASVFAILHGYVHILEGVTTGSLFTYSAGFISASAMLLIFGLMLGSKQNSIRQGFAWLCSATGLLLLAGF